MRVNIRGVMHEKRFNLSILECKFKYLAQFLRGYAVLIYPYWNVNLFPLGKILLTVWF